MVNYKYSSLFTNDSVDKQLLIRTDDGLTEITNTELHFEQFELEESFCSESELRFGCCEASSIKFTISNVFIPLNGKWLTVTETLDGNIDVPFQYGRYKVYSDKPSVDKTSRDIVAYDSMYDIINTDVADWYNTILTNTDSKVTLKEFRTSFLNYFGIEQEDVSLINDDMVVEKTIEPSEISGKVVVTAICEINGCFGHIGRNGKFQYIFLKKNIHGLYPANDLYPSDELFPVESEAIGISKSNYISCQYEDFETQSIKKLQIRQEEDDIGVIVGTDGNSYIVEDNFLVYGKSTEELTVIANNLLSVIKGITYRPFEAEASGNPCLEVGDAIRLNTKYEIIESYILRRILKGIQGLRDTYEAEGEEYYLDNVNSTQKSIKQLKGKTNKLKRTIEETQLTIKDVEKGLQSQITQTAEKIETEVLRATEAEGSLSSRITQNAESISLKVSKNNIISEINQTAESITIKASKIDLDGLVSATQFTSKYATITSLNAQKARIDTIEGSYISAGTVAANYATIDSLNVVDAKFNNLNASNITSGTLKASRIDVANLKIGADNITGASSVTVLTTTGYKTIYYIDHNGNKKEMNVLTSVGTKTIKVLGVS